ncbi:hypothetical protein ACIQGO_40395 [Streptomyces shenzhenensis]|uniref:hypothetical protein n=1 Tax=Streptomyces shenzhenensis TaxID=943815 RepID=UPI0038174C4A
MAFDILAHPAAGFCGLRPRPYMERRRVLVDVLVDVGAPIGPVRSATDLNEALLWYTALKETGVEEIVAKPLMSACKAGRIWSRVRHADTVDAAAVGFTGSARHPKSLAGPHSASRTAWAAWECGRGCSPGSGRQPTRAVASGGR